MPDRRDTLEYDQAEPLEEAANCPIFSLQEIIRLQQKVLNTPEDSKVLNQVRTEILRLLSLLSPPPLLNLSEYVAARESLRIMARMDKSMLNLHLAQGKITPVLLTLWALYC